MSTVGVWTWGCWVWEDFPRSDAALAVLYNNAERTFRQENADAAVVSVSHAVSKTKPDDPDSTPSKNWRWVSVSIQFAAQASA